MIIKRTINFYPNKDKERNGYAPLRCYVRFNSQSLVFNLGYNVTLNAWNTDTQRCKRNTFHDKQNIPANEINKIIASCEDIVNDCFSHFEQDEINPTKEELKELIDIKTGKIKEKNIDKNNFLQIFDQYISKNSSIWAYNSLKHIRSVRNQMAQFDKNCKLSDFDDVNMPDKIINFFLSIGDGNNNYTIYRKMKFIKAVLRYAIDNGYIQDSNFLNWKTLYKMPKRPVIFLTWDELMKIYNHDFSFSQCLSSVRDVFCFCCFTSLRYSDVANLKASNIINDTIHITTVKTADALTIELNKFAKAILDKYKGETFKKGRILPVVSNQKSNDHLKEIAKICEINTPITITSYKGAKRVDTTYPKHQLITTHVGRRTFISNAIMLGIAPEIVMKWSGHSDYNSMKPYIAIANEAKKKAMSIFDKL